MTGRKRIWSTYPRAMSPMQNFSTLSAVVSLICLTHKVSVDDLIRHCRKPGLVAARQMAIALVATHTTYKTKLIGDLFGRCHSNITHSLRAFHNDYTTNPRVRAQYDPLSALFQHSNPL